MTKRTNILLIYLGVQMMKSSKDVLDLELLNQVVPPAQELSEEEMKSVLGGDCGCGLICTFTGDCKCTNGFSPCWGIC